MDPLIHLRVGHRLGDDLCCLGTDPVIGVPGIGVPHFVVVFGCQLHVVVQKYIVLVVLRVLLVLSVYPHHSRQSFLLCLHCSERGQAQVRVAGEC